VSSLAFSPDGRLLASTGIDGFAILWELPAQRAIQIWNATNRVARSVAFSGDGSRLAVALGNTAVVWDLKRATEVRRVSGCERGGEVRSVALSQDGRWLVTACRLRLVHYYVYLWNVETGEKLWTLGNAKTVTVSAAYRPFANEVAICGEKVWFWNMDAHQCTRSVERHQRTVNFVTYNPRGDLFASAGWDGRINILDAATVEPISSIKGISGAPLNIAFSPDSRRLASAGRFNGLRVYEVNSGRDLLSLSGQTAPTCVTFSPDGNTLASGGEDGSITLWLTRPLPYLEQLELNAVQVRSRLAELQRTENIPPRNPRLSPKLIDLSPHYNAGLDEPLHTKANPGNNLSVLPRGLQTLAGIQFDVRGVVQLSSSRVKELDPVTDYPERVNGIKVGRQCRRLHFLHASGIAVADGTQIGSYIVHYADGQQSVIPLIYGKNVRDWWVFGNEAPARKQLQVAWTGTNAAPALICLFKTTWDNPLPGLEISTIDYVSKMTPAAPFLVALTVE